MRDKLSHEDSHDLFRFLDRCDLRSILKSKHWLSGRHPSARQGDSPEFKEFREHRSGESVRLIDWKSSARTQQQLVRVKDHQGTLEHWVWCDNSSSMAFPKPEDPHNKFKQQKVLLGLLLYLIHAQGDHFSLGYSQQGDPHFNNMGRSPKDLTDQVGELFDLSTDPQHQPHSFLGQHNRHHKRKPSHFWIASDLDRELDPLFNELQNLKHQGHQVHLLHLYHPQEKELPWNGPHIFEDLEHHIDPISIPAQNIREAYQQAHAMHLEEAHSRCLNASIHFTSLDVTQAPEAWLSSIFLSLHS